tara:strand:+ start:286 stop:1179 length:894 start_codon:yes stop_codon:yes gene_type:complete
MKLTYVFSLLLITMLLNACGPSAEEKRQVEMEQQRIEQEVSERLAKEKADRTAAVTCSILGETRNMDAAIRVEKMNDAREKIGGEPFLRGDDAIQEAFEWGLCQELVLNENYDEILQPLKDAQREIERIAREKELEERRIATEKRAEEQRIAAEKLAEEQRIATEKRAEKQRIAAERQRIAAEKRERIQREEFAAAREKYEKQLPRRMQPLEERPIPTFVPELEHPLRAIKEKVDGYGLVRFNVIDSGYVTWVVLVEEWPIGFGFGESAVRAAKKLKYEEGAAIQGIRHKFLFKQEK